MQKATGTFKRNEYIRWLFLQGESMAEIGRQHNLTRQAVRKIVSEAGDNSEVERLKEGGQTATGKRTYPNSE